MNDLILLRTDLKQRYADAVRSRTSLQRLEIIVESLENALNKHALQLIRPENNYWAAFSNVMAGAVEETRVILEDALFVSHLNPIIRFCSYFCLGMGLDADVEVISTIFLQIKQAVAVSGNLDDLQEKRSILRKVNSMGFKVNQKRLQHSLSKIQEEPCYRSIDSFTSQSELIKSEMGCIE